jgi:uncharacterized protein
VKALHLGEDLTLPLDAVTQTFGILAVRGAGKSNLAAVMAEEMFDAGLPFVVVDPVGSWWGLRSELAIPIFGGRHADVPLEKTGGALVADLVVGQRLTCVLDVSELSEGDKTRFLIDFAERLYRQNTEPLHLFLEEADDFCPQRPFHEQARLVRSWENVVRRGRARGLGITMITQRSAALNKNVLTQIETLFVLRTTSPQDRKAIEGWVEYHGQAREVLESLSSLAAGEAWVWSPSYLKTMKRVQVRRRRTFDSGATPKSGSSRKPATLADVDLGAVTKAMAATIERAKTEDPRELRRRIVELERELKAKPAAAAPAVPKRVEVPALNKLDRRVIQAATERLERAVAILQSVVQGNAAGLEKAAADLRAALNPPAVGFRTALSDVLQGRPAYPSNLAGTRRTSAPPSTDRKPTTSSENGRLGRAERAILTAIAQREPRRSTNAQAAILSGYSLRSSSFHNALSTLRTTGLIEGSGDAMRALPAGLATAGDVGLPPTPEELLGWWRAKLGKAERTLLEALVVAGSAGISRDQLSERSGYSATSSSFHNAISTLRTLELISGRGELRASEELFS